MKVKHDYEDFGAMRQNRCGSKIGVVLLNHTHKVRVFLRASLGVVR